MTDQEKEKLVRLFTLKKDLGAEALALKDVKEA